MNSTNYLIIQAGFIVLSIIYVGWLLLLIKRGLLQSGKSTQFLNKIIIAVVVWVAFLSAISLSGFLSDFSTFPPRMTIVVIIPLVTIITFSFNKTLKEVLKQIPHYQIIQLQSFRIFVEILLWMLFTENLLPIQMTFEGYNFDVLSGIGAVIIVYFFRTNRNAIIIYNILGLVLLINIVTIAVLSMPTPLRVFMNEPANTIVTYFPIALLPGLLVPLAYTLHIFSLKQVLSQKQ